MKKRFKHLTLARVTDIMIWTVISALGTMAITGILFMIYGLIFLDFGGKANFACCF